MHGPALHRHTDCALPCLASFCSQYDNAIQWYQESLAVQPDKASTLSALGIAQHLAGQLREAVATFHAVSGCLVTHFCAGNTPLQLLPLLLLLQLFTGTSVLHSLIFSIPSAGPGDTA